MKDELVSITTARLAHNKGFDWECDQFHTVKGMEIINVPTKALLQKWLREKHKIQVEVHSYHKGKTWHHSGNTYYEVVVGRGGDGYITTSNFLTYEEALETGLQEALKTI